MYVVINQSSPLPISIFLSLCLLFPPPYTRKSNQLAYMQACMVCMYACVHIGVHCWQDGVLLRGSNTDGNPSYGSVRWNYSYGSVTGYIASQVRPGRPLEQDSHLSGCTRVCICACKYIGAFACVCVSVDWVKIYGYRGSQEVKKGHRIDIAKWMYVPKDWVCVRTREINLLMTSSWRHINDTN